jgi:hypothetical protein
MYDTLPFYQFALLTFGQVYLRHKNDCPTLTKVVNSGMYLLMPV